MNPPHNSIGADRPSEVTSCHSVLLEATARFVAMTVLFLPL